MPPAKGMKPQSCFLQAYGRGNIWEVLEEGSASGHFQVHQSQHSNNKGNATHRWSAKANELLDPHTVNILTPFHRSNYCVVNQHMCSVCPDLDFQLFKHLCLREHILVLFLVGKRLLSGIKQQKMKKTKSTFEPTSFIDIVDVKQTLIFSLKTDHTCQSHCNICYKPMTTVVIEYERSSLESLSLHDWYKCISIKMHKKSVKKQTFGNSRLLTWFKGLICSSACRTLPEVM